MHNHDILIRVRYALDIKNKDMVEIFKLGGVNVTQEEVMEMLTKPKEEDYDEYEDEDVDFYEYEDEEDTIKCNNKMMESFLNGLIIFKRGKREPKPGQPESPAPTGKESVNNVLLKKLKIALTLTSEDMIEILGDAGVNITKGELGAILRKEGHRNYKQCGDRYARNFLKGLTLKYRG